MDKGAAETNSKSFRPSFAERANQRVTDLLRQGARDEIETFRIQPNSGNNVYWVPLGDDLDEFVIVKLPPSWRVEMHRLRKVWSRNLAYGERCTEPLGKGRAEMEKARYREWQAEGLPVPALIDTPLPHVRIIQGLPFPTLRAVLADPEASPAGKLRVAGEVLRALSQQHQLAISRGRPGLVHPEPSPQNILFDSQTDQTYWFDLEHPDAYPGMTVEDTAARSLRFLVYGVLDHLPECVDEVVELLMEHYESTQLLWRMADKMQHSLQAFPLRLARRAGLGKARAALQQRVVHKLYALLTEQKISAVTTPYAVRR